MTDLSALSESTSETYSSFLGQLMAPIATSPTQGRMHFVHLDNAASSFPKPPAVKAAVGFADHGVVAETAHGVAEHAADSTTSADRVREDLSRVLGTAHADRVVLTDYASTALDLIIAHLVRGPGAHVVTTDAEHAAVFRALERARARVDRVTVDDSGRADAQAILDAVGPKTDLIVLCHASHVTGVMQPVAEVAEEARSRGIPLVVNAAATVGAVSLSVDTLGADVVVFTGHKYLFGPVGAAGMWVRRRLGVPDVPPGCAPEEPALAGLAAGLAFVIGSGPLAVATYLGELAETLRRKLSAVPHVRVRPPAAGKAHAPIVSLTVDRLASQAVASRLHTQFGVICAAGEHAAPHLHGPLGTAPTGTLRFSPGPFNTVEDLDHAVAALKEVSEQRAPAA